MFYKISKKIPKTIEMEQLSGVMIIIIIGGGVLTFVLLFIFAKRQIMRFTLRSRRGPHVPVGSDAKKALRREIERRLECIQKIAQEPKLLWNDERFIMNPDRQLPPFYYRMQAVDDIKILEKEIERADGSVRHPYDSLRAFLLTTLAGTTLNGCGQRMIHQFCDMYEHARHDPNEFGKKEYETYHRMLLKLIDAAQQIKNYANLRKLSPVRTPKKQTRMHSLLDPARLRPPPLHDTATAACGELAVGQQSKVNLTLGLSHNELVTSSDIPANPLRLQLPSERDLVIRNRIKTPTLDDANDNDNNAERNTRHTNIVEQDNNLISNITSAQFYSNMNVI